MWQHFVVSLVGDLSPFITGESTRNRIWISIKEQFASILIRYRQKEIRVLHMKYIKDIYTWNCLQQGLGKQSVQYYKGEKYKKQEEKANQLI